MQIERMLSLGSIIIITLYALLVIGYLHHTINEKLMMLNRYHNYPYPLEQLLIKIQNFTNALFNSLYIIIIILAIFSIVVIIIHKEEGKYERIK